MLFNTIIAAQMLLGALLPQNFAAFSDWYTSFTRQFEFCVAVDFQNPICPRFAGASKIDYAQSPEGTLSSKTLLEAQMNYRSGHSPRAWLESLQIEMSTPKNLDPQLLANARLLLAQTLYDDKQYERSEAIYDSLLPYFKGRGLYHQQRAWVKFFRGKYGEALGSIMSAESPLIYKVKFPKKYFLRGLIERELCNYDEALHSISEGRNQLRTSQPDLEHSPWVDLCLERKLGARCEQLRSWENEVAEHEKKEALTDLDFLELELSEKGFKAQKTQQVKPIVWPFIGEKWADELGRYSVEVPSSCGA